MKLSEMAGVASGYDIQKNTKKSAKAQAEAAASGAAYEKQVLQHLAFQSQALAEIRDLLKAQQGQS